MIDVKEATNIAADFVNALYSQEQLTNGMLEEVELSDDDAYWYITLGFNHITSGTHPIEPIRIPQTQRIYKTVKIDTETGQPRAMKNKDVPTA